MNITSLDLTIIALPIAILLTALFSRTREDVLRAQAKSSFIPVQHKAAMRGRSDTAAFWMRR